MKEMIQQTIKAVVHDLFDITVDPIVAVPSDLSHGDYTCNVSFQLAKQVGKSPKEIGEQIVERLHTDKQWKVEVIGGYLNFFVDTKEIGNRVESVITHEEIVGIEKVENPRFEMYENTGPNTNKPLHLGHVRNIILADSLIHLRKALGQNVWSVNINNDRGIHICKAMMGYLYLGLDNEGTKKFFERSDFQDQLKKFIEDDAIKQLDKYPWHEVIKLWAEHKKYWLTPEKETSEKFKKPDHFIGKYYIEGVKYGEEKTVFAMYTQEMLQAWENGDEMVRALWSQMNEWFYEGFRQTHSRLLGISVSHKQYDKEWYESEIYQAGKELVLQNLDKGVFFKRDDGAVLANLDAYNLPEKVMLRADGTSVYITQDLELSRQRVQEEHADFVAYIVADEQSLHFKELFAICEELGIGKKEQFAHIGYGMVNLKGGEKMSSRKGNVISGDDLMDIVKKRIIETFKTTDVTGEQVGLGAIKYALLRSSSRGEIEFDLEESIGLQGNSGPYIQYSYARTQSLLEKANQLCHCEGGTTAAIPHREDCFAAARNDTLGVATDMNPDELTLARLLYHFPDTVTQAAGELAPHVICTYLFEVAQTFNTFYQKYRILDGETPEKRDLRLGLVRATGAILKQGLGLLGIEAPSKM